MPILVGPKPIIVAVAYNIRDHVWYVQQAELVERDFSRSNMPLSVEAATFDQLIAKLPEPPSDSFIKVIAANKEAFRQAILERRPDLARRLRLNKTVRDGQHIITESFSISVRGIATIHDFSLNEELAEGIDGFFQALDFDRTTP